MSIFLHALTALDEESHHPRRRLFIWVAPRVRAVGARSNRMQQIWVVGGRTTAAAAAAVALDRA